MKLDLAYLRQWIGRVELCEDYASESLINRFNATFNRAVTLRNGDEAPPLIHLCLAPAAAMTEELGEDGHPARGGFLPPISLPRRMWAGGSFSFTAPVRVGSIVNRRSTIRDVVVKNGRTGTLCFVTVDHQIESNGEIAVCERQDIVYRDFQRDEPDSLPKATTPLAPEGNWRETVDPTAPLLFRYSALTFNGHRIHYDLPYTRDVEGYPGLIIHGPLQATLLVHFAEKLKGKPPRSFEFKSLSPLFDNASFTLNAWEEDHGLRLWTSRADGPVAMEAKASW